jgi:chaperonin GroES
MIRPLNDYVALQAIEEEAVTASGIYLGTTKNKQPMGKVVAVNSLDAALAFQGGEVVYYKNGIEIKEGNETYIMVKESDLIAVVEVEE